MCWFCTCFCPKKKTIVPHKRHKQNKRRTIGRTTFNLYGTNWEEKIGTDPNISPSKIDDSTFSRNVKLDKKLGDRITLYKQILNSLDYEMCETEPLGKGGFGSVFKIRKKSNQQLFAVKVMQLKIDEESKTTHFQMFKSEVFSLKMINHRNIIRIIDHFIVDDILVSFMILEFATEGDLYHKMKNTYKQTNKPLPEEEVQRYFAQISNALNCVHSKKIAHRDLKLDNILITKIDGKEVIKVTDFGCARVAHKEQEGVIMSEMAAGTIAYMAPEVLKVYICHKGGRDNQTDRSRLRYNPFKADMWSLGVCLYRMLSNEYPFKFKSKDPMKSLYPMVKSMRAGLKIPKDMSNRLNPKCLDLLSDLLEYNKEKRITMDLVMRHQWVRESAEADSFTTTTGTTTSTGT